MSKQWTLNGKSVGDFTSKIDYTLDNLQDRLDLVRNVLGQENILYNSSPLDGLYKYDDFFANYFFPNEFIKKSKITDTVYDTSLAYELLKYLECKEKLTKKQSKQYLEVLEFVSLLEKEIRSEQEEIRLTKLANRYCEKYQEVVSYEYHGEYYNYTPHIGTANEVNLKQVVSSLKPLSDSDYVCKALESMGSYLIRQAEREEKEENKDNPEYELSSPTLSSQDAKKNMKREQLEDSSETEWQKHGEAPTSKKNQVIISSFEVSESDRDYIIGGIDDHSFESKFPHFLKIDRSESRRKTENKMGKLLVESGESLALLRKMMETKQHVGTTKAIERKDLYKIQLWIGDIKKNESEILKGSHRYIDFKKIEKGFAEITFDDNTGYEGINGFYCIVSENKFDFSKKKHIASLIKVYPDIAGYEERVETDIYHIMFVLRKLIHLADRGGILKNHELDILKWHMYDNLPVVKGKNEPVNDDEGNQKCKTIQELLKEVHGLEWDHPQISRMLNHTMPTKLQNIFLTHQEVWAYTFRIRGKYKKCNGCHKNKLSMKKYFTLDKKSKDGYGFCRVCKSKK